jgi:hypothetical protein
MDSIGQRKAHAVKVSHLRQQGGTARGFQTKLRSPIILCQRPGSEEIPNEERVWKAEAAEPVPQESSKLEQRGKGVDRRRIDEHHLQIP